jgi:hypothetical protein
MSLESKIRNAVKNIIAPDGQPSGKRLGIEMRSNGAKMWWRGSCASSTKMQDLYTTWQRALRRKIGDDYHVQGYDDNVIIYAKMK